MSGQPPSWQHATRRQPCPRCRKNDWCRRSPDGTVIDCYRVNDGSGTEREDAGGRLYWRYGQVAASAPELPTAPQAARADLPTLDRVYRAMLSRLRLSTAHREQLRTRGLSDAEIDARGYRTLPARGRGELAGSLVEQFGAGTCQQIPGLYLKEEDGRQWWSVGGMAGILIPARSHDDKIAALKIRADEPGECGKYLYLSSARHGGPGPGSPIHVPLFDRDTAEVRLTEGHLKGDVATALSGVLTLSMPGTSVWRPVLPVLEVLGVRRVRLALDADARDNRHVALALRHTWEALTSAGYTVELELWDPALGKGVDDLLAANQAPERIAPSLVPLALAGIVSTALERDPVPEPPASLNGHHEHPPLPSLAVTRNLAEVEPERVRWLWPGRIPLGKLTVIDGDPGLGKSFVSLDLSARVSNGADMPDGARSDLAGAAGVVLLSAEDGLADTIRPRLDAAGANVARIEALEAVCRANPDGDTLERLPTLLDVAAIEEAMGRVSAVLVIVDPLMAYLPADTDSHRDQDVRIVLRELARLADRTGAAVLLIRHLNKSPGGAPLYRGGGSIGIVGACRSGMLVARDPDDPEGLRRVLASTKSNLGAPPTALAYQIAVGPEDVPYVDWLGTSQHTAAALLGPPAAPVDGAQAEAEAFLADALATGARPANELLAEARKAGVSERTLRRAKTALGVCSVKESMQGVWMWALPAGHEPPPAEEEAPPKAANPLPLAALAAFGENGAEEAGFRHKGEGSNGWQPSAGEDGTLTAKIANRDSSHVTKAANGENPNVCAQNGGAQGGSPPKAANMAKGKEFGSLRNDPGGVLALARAAFFPRLTLPNGPEIQETFAAWKAFTTTAKPEQLETAALLLAAPRPVRPWEVGA